jgi:CubicO group peptidase (beta-lactamase class C family)
MSAGSPTIHGTVDPRFARVRDAFAATFAAPLELGAAIAVTVDGQPVVDLWGGVKDGARQAPWEEDTLATLFSTTKGFTAMCAHRLVDQGKLDLDAPVARYWPEFASAGKDAIKVRSLLDHRAGLPALREPLPPEALYDFDRMARALAAEAPWWEPDTQHGYHAMTYGWLVGEVVRRVSGVSVGAYFRDELARPLGLDAHIGLPETEDARCAEMRASPRPATEEETLFERLAKAPSSMAAKAFANPITLMVRGTLGSRAWRGAEVPAVNGHGTARSIARLYGALACGGAVGGVTVLSPESIARCRAERSFGVDAILGTSTRFGLGFMLTQPGGAPGATFGPSAGAFGHPGAGGSLGFADPEARVGFGYAMNRMGTSILVDPRASSLIDAVYASLAPA